MISQKNAKSWRNPWFFAVISGVLLTVSVNGVLIWWSMQQNRSSFVDVAYNAKNRKSDTEVMNDIETRNALAWKVAVKAPKELVLNVPAHYEIDVVDKTGELVRGELAVEAYRAADASKDFVTKFTEIAPGKYQGDIAFPLKGYWELRIKVKRGQEVFQTDSGRFTVAEK